MAIESNLATKKYIVCMYGIVMLAPVASTRVQGWRDEAPKGLGCGGGVWRGGSAPSPENFLVCDLEMAYFGEF